MKLNRYKGNPILRPHPKNEWENLVTTNPGAWYDDESGQVYLMYRAAGNDPEHRIYLGLATSSDGYHFERVSDFPVFSPSFDGFDAGCVEDPRIVKHGNYFFITYACRPFPPGQYWLPDKETHYNPPHFPSEFPKTLRENSTHTGLALTKDFKTYIRAGCLTDPMVDDRDVILFPEKINGAYFMIHRPMDWIGGEYGTDHPAIWISQSNDWLNFRKSDLLAKAKYDWELKIGANTPPMKTEHGWLLLYHAVGTDEQYRVGAMLLALDDPTKVTHRTPDWLIQPEEDYELNGFYKGVIFPCGKVVIDETLFVYYGGADKYVGLATCKMKDLLDYLNTCPD